MSSALGGANRGSSYLLISPQRQAKYKYTLEERVSHMHAGYYNDVYKCL